MRFHSFHLPSLAGARLRLPDIAAKADQKLRFATLFPLLAAQRRAAAAGRNRYDLLYGYEVHGVLAAATRPPRRVDCRWWRASRAPSCTRTSIGR